MAVSLLYVETKQSAVNRALGTVIRGALRADRITIAEASKRTGLTVPVLNRMVSRDPRDINVTQLVLIARLLGVTAQELLEQAEKRAERMSDAPANVSQFPPRPDSAAEIEDYPGDMAAHPRDPESDLDE
jgi:transcriptional regulator with XRE-family HTH domain